MKLWKFQEEGVAWLKEVKRGILGDDMGLGKTVQAIEAWRDTKPKKTLVICPGTLRSRWQTGFRDQLNLKVPFVQGNKAERLKMYITQPDVLIISYDTLRGDFDKIIKMKFDCIIIDEAHRLKNRQAVTTKKSFQLRTKNPEAEIWLLTGTPIRHHETDIWALLHLIAPIKFPSFWKWAEQHFVINSIQFGASSRAVKKIGACKDKVALAKEIQPYLLRRLASEVIEDIGKLEVRQLIHEVPLTIEQQKAYKTLVDKWLLYKKENDPSTVVLVDTAMALQLRLRQTCISPGIIHEHDLKHHDTAKFKFMDALLEDSDCPWMIVSSFRGTIKMLEQRYGMSQGVSICWGGMTQQELEHEKKLFLEGKNRIFAGTIDSIAEGLDQLQTVCHKLVFFDGDWIPTDDDQVIGRLKRMGQKELVEVHRIFCQGTLEQKLFHYVEAKRGSQDVLIRQEDVISLLDQENGIFSED